MTFPFVTAGWLHKRLDHPNIAIVDGSWYLPAMGRDPEAEFLEGHIPGAVHLDIEAVKDETSSLPHMMPTPEVFAEYVGKLGINEVTTIVVYDGMGLFSAPRVRWMFRTFGAITVFILEGGLPAWKTAGFPLESGPARERSAKSYLPRIRSSAIANVETVRQALSQGIAQVVDARGADRFRGEAAEPRPGVRAGHIPGSKNLPSGDLVADGKLKEPQELRALINRAAINLDQPVITSCGSGVTAAIVSLAFERLGYEPRALYDGSWSEWGSREDLPIETGS